MTVALVAADWVFMTYEHSCRQGSWDDAFLQDDLIGPDVLDQILFA